MMSFLTAQTTTDPIFGLTPFEFFFGAVVFIVVLAILFWVLRSLHII